MAKIRPLNSTNQKKTINKIGTILTEVIPTLEFAKECIEELGGKENMLYNLRNSFDYREKGKIYKMRKRVIQHTELFLIDSSLPDEELEKIKRKKLEAIRTYEVKRLKQLIDQIDEWDGSDFDDATLLLDEVREDEDLLSALQKRKQLAVVTIEINNSTEDITDETAEEVEKIRQDLAAAREKANEKVEKAEREKREAEKLEKKARGGQKTRRGKQEKRR